MLGRFLFGIVLFRKEFLIFLRATRFFNKTLRNDTRIITSLKVIRLATRLGPTVKVFLKRREKCET
jgi:hypothetical protein